MRTLEQIKDEYAVSKDYITIIDIINECIIDFDHERILKLINDISIESQKECLKLASENAELKHDFNILNKPNIYKSEKRIVGLGTDFYEVNKESITNENNIIK